MRAGSLLLRPTPPSLWLGIAVAASLIVVETLLVYPLRQAAPESSLTVFYLLGVLVVSTVWGLRLGAATAVASVLVVNLVGVATSKQFTAVSVSRVLAECAIFLTAALLTGSLANLSRSQAAEAKASREELRLLALEQAALRRVATLVAHGVPPSEVFDAVTMELARLLGLYTACTTWLLHYEPDGTVTVVSTDQPSLAPGQTRWPFEGDNLVALVWDTGRAMRMDSFEAATGRPAAIARELGVRCAVGAPIIVEGRLWGMAAAASMGPEPLPPETEARMVDFTELAATAIANADSRAELIASRARIVAAADEARRCIERDLHDGAQQQLVALALELRAAEAETPPELHTLKAQLSHATQGLTSALENLRETARGIHPAVLSTGGLGPALRTLARRSAVPVKLDVHADSQLPEPVGVAAYYIASEALTNTAKHAQASEVHIDVDTQGGIFQLSIRDDGVGGADPACGSGLAGLRDRVEALGGQMEITSPTGGGTSLLVKILMAGEAAGVSPAASHTSMLARPCRRP